MTRRGMTRPLGVDARRKAGHDAAEHEDEAPYPRAFAVFLGAGRGFSSRAGRRAIASAR